MDPAFRNCLIKQSLRAKIACLTRFCVCRWQHQAAESCFGEKHKSPDHVFVNVIMYFVIKRDFFFFFSEFCVFFCTLYTSGESARWGAAPSAGDSAPWERWRRLLPKRSRGSARSPCLQPAASSHLQGGERVGKTSWRLILEDKALIFCVIWGSILCFLE